MSPTHDIDNQDSVFDFDFNDFLEPLSLLEDSTREHQLLAISSPDRAGNAFLFNSSSGLPTTYNMAPGGDALRATAATPDGKGKGAASSGASQPLSIPGTATGPTESEINVFSMSFGSEGSSSARYEPIPAFDFQSPAAIAFLAPDGVPEVSMDDDEMNPSPNGKGKARELPPTLPPLSFSPIPQAFRYGSADWSSVAGPSSYGSGITSIGDIEFSPTSPSPLSPVAPTTTPTTPEAPASSSSEPIMSRRRTLSSVSRTSKHSLSLPSVPRMKVKFASNKPSRPLSKFFKKSPLSSPRHSPNDLSDVSMSSSLPVVLPDLSFVNQNSSLIQRSRSPPSTPMVETNVVWGVVDPPPIYRLPQVNDVRPMRTKGRTYSSPLPFPSSIYDIIPAGSTEVLAPLQPLPPAYFDEYLPHELKLQVLVALIGLHEVEFQKRVKEGKWTALKASRNKWVGRDKGLRELFKLSRVSRSWRNLAFDGQLWFKLDLRSFPKVPSSVLVHLSQIAGGFVKSLDLEGHTELLPNTFIDISHYLSASPALTSSPCDNHTQLTTINFQGCYHLSTRSLHHILMRSPNLERLCLKGLTAVTNTTCDILANYCSRLTHLDMGRCPNITGDGIRSAAATAIARGESIRLKHLRLSGLKKVTDDTMTLLGRAAPFLEVLDLSYAKDLHNSAIEAFVACTEEDSLQFEAVSLTAREAGRDPADPTRYRRRVTRIRHLNLSSCLLLTDHACSHLAHTVPKLEFLELGGIGPELRDDGLVRLLNTTPYIRKLDLEDATEVTDDVLEALTPPTPVSTSGVRPSQKVAPPVPGHALEHLIISYADVDSDAISGLIHGCTRLRVLEADNTRMSGLTLKEFVQTARRRKTADAKIVAVDCRSVGEFSVKEMTAHSRPRLGWRAWDARRLHYLDARDEEDLNVGQDECDPYRVVVKTFYSWQTVDAVKAAREKKRKAGLKRGASASGSSAQSDEAELASPGRSRWWSPNGRRSAPSTPTLLDLNTDRGEGCTIM